PGSWGRPPVFSPDGSVIAVPIGNSVGLFDARTGRRLHQDDTTVTNGFRSAASSRAGDRIVTGAGDGRVLVWHATSGTPVCEGLLATVVGPSGWNANPAFVGFSPDGKSVIAAGRPDEPVEYRTGIVVVFDAASGERLREISLKELRGAAMSAD